VGPALELRKARGLVRRKGQARSLGESEQCRPRVAALEGQFRLAQAQPGRGHTIAELLGRTIERRRIELSRKLIDLDVHKRNPIRIWLCGTQLTQPNELGGVVSGITRKCCLQTQRFTAVGGREVSEHDRIGCRPRRRGVAASTLELGKPQPRRIDVGAPRPAHDEGLEFRRSLDRVTVRQSARGLVLTVRLRHIARGLGRPVV